MIKSVNMMSKRCFLPLSLVALRSSSCYHSGLSRCPLSLGSLIYAAEGMTPPIWLLQRYNLDETWRTLHPRWISHAPGAISVHGGVLPGETQSRALLSELSALRTRPQRPERNLGNENISCK